MFSHHKDKLYVLFRLPIYLLTTYLAINRKENGSSLHGHKVKPFRRIYNDVNSLWRTACTEMDLQ